MSKHKNLNNASVEQRDDMQMKERDRPYRKLFLMAALSFCAMYILMYAMVDRIENVLPNLNQLYMASLMTAPMVAIEIVLMSAMYPSKSANMAIVGGAGIVLFLAFFFIRAQVGIGDREFLRSMIPHHASAVLMCQKANVANPEIKRLCGEITSSQNSEIALMKQLLDNSHSAH